MIIQQNPERPNLAVTVDENNPALLCVAEHELPNGAVVQAATFDLTPHQGSPYRLYVEEDGRLEPALDGVHYWLLAEVMVPEKRMETSEVPGGEGEESRTEMVELPLDLRQAEIVVHPWPQPAESGEEE